MYWSPHPNAIVLIKVIALSSDRQSDQLHYYVIDRFVYH